MENTNTTEKLSFVLYERKNIPRYFEIKKNFLKFLVIALPLISLLSLTLIVIVAIYFKQIKQYIESKQPRIINELKQGNINLNQRLQALTSLNNELQEKLGSKTPSSFENMNLIKAVPGQKDLTQSPTIKIDNFILTSESHKVAVKFHLVNLLSEEHRVSGHLFIVMRQKNSVHIHPHDSFSQDELQTSFNKGEPFGFSRLRPVYANFPLIHESKKLLFHILIFSFTGDLMHQKSIEYELKNTQEKNV